LKKALFWTVALECALLAGGLLAYQLGWLDRFAREPAAVPVFRPTLPDCRIGDFVRYEIRDKETGEPRGYLDYEVRQVIVTKGTTIGPEIILFAKEASADGKTSRERFFNIQPRALMKGFLPPRFDDDEDYPAGERPVIARISTATFPLQERPPDPLRPPPAPVRGFLVEAVIPRRSLTEIAERYWMSDEVPVFGVARWERGDEVLVVHRMDKPPRRAAK
jgi:hypothetical protein